MKEKLISKHFTICTFIFIVNILILMSINYVVGCDYTDYKYGIGKGLIFVRRDKKNEIIGNSNSFEFLKDFEDVHAVFETDKPEIMGVYDPQYYYYIRSTKILSDNNYYFSKKDFKNNINKGILIYPIDYIVKENRRPDIEYNEKLYNTKIINIFDPFSLVCEGNFDTKIVKNIFFIPCSRVEKIYISKPQNNEIDTLVQSFNDNGFISISTNTSLIKTFSRLDNMKPYAKRFLKIGISVFLMFIATFNFYLSSQKENMFIHVINGATKKDILNLSIRNNIVILITILVSSLLTIFYLKGFNKLDLVLNQIIVIELCYYLSMIISVYINIYRFNNYIRRNMRW